MICYSRYRQTKRESCRRLVLDTAMKYLTSDPPKQSKDVELFPGAVADAISAELTAFRLTGDRGFLDRAHTFAEFALEVFFDGGKTPLPYASNRRKHYEAITGGPGLVMALLDLWGAMQTPPRDMGFPCVKR